MKGFNTVLVANRGEIALRVIRACKRLGLRSVAACSEADRDGAYLEVADQAICIGGGPASESYLNPQALMLALEACGADAVHPGYGFLSENADFAEMVEAAGATFIGPTPAMIRIMGDKIAAKSTMLKAGVPCVPGTLGALPDDIGTCVAEAETIGYPIIIKAAGGGGGRGMRVVRTAAELPEALRLTREEAGRTFRNPAVYLEKFLKKPRHIEIQVLCDQHGNGVWLGERDCSVQRRHQKLIEEGPAQGIPRELITHLGETCARACRDLGYRGVGTLEFLYEDGTFAFIEMNTRIQVEHPVTELLTGVDLVAEQIKAAQGLPLGLKQEDIASSGHAIECRINAENGMTGLPSPGTILRWHSPGGPGVRVDSHVAPGVKVPPYYDSLIGKIIVSGADRAEALDRMKAALSELEIYGLQVNVDLHQLLLEDPQFSAGPVSIHYLETLLAARQRASS